MDSIIEQQKSKYDRLWQNKKYRPERFEVTLLASALVSMEAEETNHIIDWGCGDGKIAKFLIDNRLMVHGIDISNHCLCDEMKGEVKNFYFTQECLWKLSSKV